MNFKRLESTIMQDEGFSARPYLDTRQIPTIGYGTTRILGKPVELEDPAITAQQARQLLRADLYEACIDAQQLFIRFNDLNHVRQEVLVNMAYNLGRRGLSRFQRMRAAADLLDYQGMANEMRDSRWFHQVGQRSRRLVRQMRFGA